MIKHFTLRGHAGNLAPGALLSATIAAAAAFLGAHYAAPVMLFALLLGMAFNFLHEQGPCRAGVEFASKGLLRLGVGLLGIRIVLEDLAQIGLVGAGVLVGLIVTTIGVGFLAAPLLRCRWRFALLTGGAVAICGASAALAIAAVLPADDRMERDTLFTVMAVTALSTIAMVVYPLLFGYLGFSDIQQGFLIGATIHDVAQVVGAGFSVSDEAGNTATIVKLFRVAMLPVVLIAIVIALRLAGGGQQAGHGAGHGAGKIPLLPWFMLLFLALVLLGSVVDLPPILVAKVDLVSRICLITAIAALGIKTSLRALSAVGGGHMAIIVLETMALLGIATFALYLLQPV
ncbi:MAG: putative sulfate exporter family transporter [Rhodobacteraceae bacterium]|nr:putative sulfate exporter family transporter [Paracoccaceae bacterium]